MAVDREYIWVSPWGEEWNLTTGNRGVYLEQGAQADFPHAQAHEATESLIGRAGEIVTGVDIPSAEGSIRVVCYPHDRKSAQQVESEFKAAFSRREPGGLEVRGWLGGNLQLAAYLSPREFDGPTRQGVHGSFAKVVAHIVGRDALYRQPNVEAGTVTITNLGDDMVRPQVRWQQGGTLVMPSGVRITLPTVPEERVLVLDEAESCVVLDPDGQPDELVWGSFPVYPEGVPEGETRTYTAPEGALVEWSVGYTNPWK